MKLLSDQLKGFSAEKMENVEQPVEEKQKLQMTTFGEAWPIME